MTTLSILAGAHLKDYYRVLRVDPGAAGAAVEQAYWRLARQYSAAIEADPEASASLDELNEAYRVLGSPTLRTEYDRVRGVVLGGDSAQAERKPKPVLPSIAALTVERARWRQEAPLLGGGARVQLSLRNFAARPWWAMLGMPAMLLLGGIALLAGAEPGPVVALAVIGLAFAAFPLVAHQGPAGQSGETGGTRRRLVRPANLGNAPIPGGASRGLRRLVYEVYEQCPHLGPADVRTVARYALLTQRFLRGERRLRQLEVDLQSPETWQLTVEQRALAAELRLHEAALGVTAARRAAALAVDQGADHGGVSQPSYAPGR